MTEPSTDRDTAAEQFARAWDDDEGPGSSPDGRRVSHFEEVVDGGYSIGSAAPLDDGAMPVGHPVKAWEDTKTYATPEDSSYADGEPHVWFADSEVAEQSGFRHAG